MMKIDELPAYLESELTYSLSHEAVLDRAGSVEVDAPDSDATEEISAIIDAVGQESYESAQELYETIMGNVGDEFIGRKFYDDRGGNPIDTRPGPMDDAVSF